MWSTLNVYDHGIDDWLWWWSSSLWYAHHREETGQLQECVLHRYILWVDVHRKVAMKKMWVSQVIYNALRIVLSVIVVPYFQDHTVCWLDCGSYCRWWLSKVISELWNWSNRENEFLSKLKLIGRIMWINDWRIKRLDNGYTGSGWRSIFGCDHNIESMYSHQCVHGQINETLMTQVQVIQRSALIQWGTVSIAVQSTLSMSGLWWSGGLESFHNKIMQMQ